VKSVLVCCEPWSREFPSGVRWLHDRGCSIAPGRKVGSKPVPLSQRPEYVDAHIDDGDDDGAYGAHGYDREWCGE